MVAGDWRATCAFAGRSNKRAMVAMTRSRMSARNAGMLLQLALVLLALAACGGGGGGTVSMPSYTLGGTVAGLSGPGLVLANGSATLVVPANAAKFSFPISLQTGASYAVTIRTQPAGQTCTITNAAGAIATSNVNNIAIACPSPWVWIGGPNSPDGAAVYGTRGVTAPGNLPGARSEGVTWTDAAGNFWLFGGIGSAPEAYFNDLWQYSTVTGQWTWVGGADIPNALGVYGTQGVAAPGNMPGARAGAVSWTDATGTFWLFGGTGFDSAEFNDLWKYSPSTGLWTWVSGSNTSIAVGVYGTRGVAAAANVPPARDDATSWIDASGDLWLFGGNGMPASNESPLLTKFQDLWEYSPASGMWTWVSGPMDVSDGLGLYGTRGAAAPSNLPGARSGGAGWADASGSLWLFGGKAAYTPELEFYSDLWTFDPHTGLWTWMGGPNVPDDITGQYGTEGTAAAANTPPSRSDAEVVIDQAGKVWLFGGNGVNPGLGELDLGPGQFNDLWRFDPATGEWTWMSGSMGTDGAATYGTQGVAAPGNVPGARAAAFLWINSDGNLFLFGGAGPFPGAGELEWNDVWKFAGADFP
jgi:hypothetical protein